jgi:hypothetical protein
MNFPGDDHKITNTDEQEVAVNASTTDEGGYDEPVSHSTSAVNSESGDARKDTGEKEVDKKKTSQQPHHFKAT